MKGTHIFKLDRTRSILALISCAIVTSVAFLSTVQGALRIVRIDASDETYFMMFTILSNLFILLCDLVVLTYAIDGIRKKRFRLPKWGVLVHFSGTLCLTITMAVTLIFIIPVKGINAVTGVNFWHHIFNPVASLLMFIFICNERMLKLNEMVITTIPFFVYAILYGIMVKLVGEEKGGWKDVYQVFERFSWPIAILLCVVFGFICGGILLLIHNVSTQVRYSYIIKSIEKNLNDKDDDFVEKDLYKLGRNLQSHSDRFDITIPIDALKILAEKNEDYTLEQLVEMYVKGALDEFVEGKAKQE